MSAFSQGPPRVGGQTYGGCGGGRMAGPRFEPLPAKPLSAASNRPCYHFGRARPAGGTANAPRGGRAGRTGARAPPKPRRACGREERRPSCDGRAGNPAGPEPAPESSERSEPHRQRPQVPRKEGRQDPRRLLGPLSGRNTPGTGRQNAQSRPRRGATEETCAKKRGVFAF